MRKAFPRSGICTEIGDSLKSFNLVSSMPHGGVDKAEWSLMWYLDEFLKIGIISLLGVMSPGPDFIMIARNSLVLSRRAGVLSALGLATGVLIHVTYVLAGIGVLLARSPSLLKAVQYAGALYLVYIGIQCLRASAGTPTSDGVDVTAGPVPVDGLAAWRMGLTTNLLNPKATLFILSVFTQVIDRTMPFSIQALLGLELALITAAWFSGVALCLSHPRVGNLVRRVQTQIDRVFGVVLVSLGIILFF